MFLAARSIAAEPSQTGELLWENLEISRLSDLLAPVIGVAGIPELAPPARVLRYGH